MERYIHEQNVVHYQKVLSETTDPTTRRTVLKLLADEQANVWPQTVQLRATFSGSLASQIAPERLIEPIATGRMPISVKPTGDPATME